MSRIEVVFLVGLCLVAGGAALAVYAEPLATHWQSEGGGASFGTVDAGLRRTYQVAALLLAAAGLAAVGMAAWRWLGHADNRARRGVG
jgi:hypothetical protein